MITALAATYVVSLRANMRAPSLAAVHRPQCYGADATAALAAAVVKLRAFRGLPPVEQVDEIVPVVPEHCRHCQQPCPGTEAPRRGPAWRHQADPRIERYLVTRCRCRSGKRRNHQVHR